MQLIPKRYAELEAQLKALQAADGPAVWQGLILGLCAKGLTADSRLLRSEAAQVLNDGQPLPGALIAVITELSLDAEDGYKKNDLPVLLPDSPASLRLKAFSDRCYGLTLGLSLDPKSLGQHQLVSQKIGDPALLDFLRTLQQLQQVDENSELSEDDFSTVLSYLEDELLALRARQS